MNIDAAAPGAAALPAPSATPAEDRGGRPADHGFGAMLDDLAQKDAPPADASGAQPTAVKRGHHGRLAAGGKPTHGGDDAATPGAVTASAVSPAGAEPATATAASAVPTKKPDGPDESAPLTAFASAAFDPPAAPVPGLPNLLSFTAWVKSDVGHAADLGAASPSADAGAVVATSAAASKPGIPPMPVAGAPLAVSEAVGTAVTQAAAGDPLAAAVPPSGDAQPSPWAVPLPGVLPDAAAAKFARADAVAPSGPEAPDTAAAANRTADLLFKGASPAVFMPPAGVAASVDVAESVAHVATPIAATVIPGAVAVTPGAAPVTPGAAPVTPGVVPVMSAAVPVTPDVVPVMSGAVPVTPGAVLVTPGAVLVTPGAAPVTPGVAAVTQAAAPDPTNAAPTPRVVSGDGRGIGTFASATFRSAVIQRLAQEFITSSTGATPAPSGATAGGDSAEAVGTNPSNVAATVVGALAPADEPQSELTAARLPLAAFTAAFAEAAVPAVRTAQSGGSGNPADMQQSGERMAAPRTAGLSAAHIAASFASHLGSLTTDPMRTSTATGSLLTPGGLDPAAEADLPRQIVQAMRVQQWADGGGEVRIKLQPQFLGEVSVRIRIEDGRVTASLEASSPAVRQWVQSNEQVLRQALADQGLELNRLVVLDEQPPRSRADTDGRQKRDQEAPKRQTRRQRGDEPGFEVVV